MIHYPVHYAAEKPVRFTRLQLALRVVAFLVIGMVGLSLSLVLAIAYLALPAFAAARLAGQPDGSAYLSEDGPRVRRMLSWLSAVFAWLGLVTDRIPQRDPHEAVRLSIDPDARGATEPTASSALWRILAGLPSAIVLALLYFVGAFVWLWSAIRILLSEEVGDAAHAYLTGVQRWTMRLLSYQASLVDTYPPYGFEDEPPRPATEAAA
jgi:hypothetical protein